MATILPVSECKEGLVATKIRACSYLAKGGFSRFAEELSYCRDDLGGIFEVVLGLLCLHWITGCVRFLIPY